MKTCSTIRGSFLQFNQTMSQKRCTDMETAIITNNLFNNKHNNHPNTIIISNLTKLTTNDTHQSLLYDRNSIRSRPPQAVVPIFFKTVITRNAILLKSTRHPCSRLKGHHLQGHPQTSKMLYVQYRKICNLITQSGRSGTAITYSWKSTLPGHLQTSELLYVQNRKICNLITHLGRSGFPILAYSWKLKPLVSLNANRQCSISHYLPLNHPIGSKRICHLIILLKTEPTKSTANFQNICSISHHLQFNHSIGSKRICHLSKLLLETETTQSTANFQNVVCSISHNLLLNHPIGSKRICHHLILLEIEPATFQNVVCLILQNLLLIHPIGPKRIAITYFWRPRLLDALARIFNNPNTKEETKDADDSETETFIISTC